MEELIEGEKESNFLLPVSIMCAAVVVAAGFYYFANAKYKNGSAAKPESQRKLSYSPEESVAPSPGVELPVTWGDLGKKMVLAGVIDGARFEKIYQSRGGLSPNEKRLLYDEGNGRLVINPGNSGVILNLLWALGLGNKNEILERGEMMDPKYGSAGNFASTGGWSLTQGSVMAHYSVHGFVPLTRPQQEAVERVSKNIYRPCCGNSTHLPDCNHGMAMLALIELMASQGVSEPDMYNAALRVNSYWFPDQYLTIAKYLKAAGGNIKTADAKEILGSNFSSAYGFKRIAEAAGPVQTKSGSCGV